MSGELFYPWWRCAAVLLADLDPVEVPAASAGEAEDVARAEWRDGGEVPEVVIVRRLDR